MAHYAFLDENNLVTQVIVGIDETELIEGLTAEEFYANRKNQRCVRTSYNNKIRKQYAGIGYIYDEINDVFIAPAPYASWQLDENFDWQPPVPKPEGMFDWNEETGNWVALLNHPLAGNNA